MDVAWLHKCASELEWRWWKAGRQGQMEVEGDGDGVGGGQRGEEKKKARKRRKGSEGGKREVIP